MALTWQALKPVGSKGGSARRRARSESGCEYHCCIVSGRGKLNTSRERGFGSRMSVNRVSTPVASYTNGRGSLLFTRLSLADVYVADCSSTVVMFWPRWSGLASMTPAGFLPTKRT